MTLRVEFDQFPATVGRVLGRAPAYVSRIGRGTLATAAAASGGPIVVAQSPRSIEGATQELVQAGMEVFEGRWSLEGGFAESPECSHIVAIAYVSGEGRPGLWMDAHPNEPTPAEALRAMFDEMLANGEVAEVSFEEFARAANPNVVVLSPAEIEEFLRAKEE